MKIKISIFLIICLIAFNLVIPTTVLSEGPPKPKEWKGEGTKIEFLSMPTMTIKNVSNQKV